MLKSSKTLAQALCLGLALVGLTPSAMAASAGSKVIKPAPLDMKTGSEKTAYTKNADDPGALVYPVNVSDKDADTAKKAKAKKSASAKRKAATKSKSATKSRKRAARSIKATGRCKAGSKGKCKLAYKVLIRKAAKRHGVPLSIAQAVVQVESNFNPRAHGSAGEVGLMQIKPATARGMGYRGSTRALYDPATNLEWGMRYLAGAHKRAGGDLCGTILRYNAGHYAKRMNPVSARYCRRVKSIISRS